MGGQRNQRYPLIAAGVVASRTSPALSSMSSTMTCFPRRPVAPLVSATPASNALLVLPHAAPLVSSRSPLLSLRVEMIQTDKINSTLKPLIQHSGGFPQRILYCCRRVEMIQTDADMKALIKNAPFLYTHSFGTCAATCRQPYLPARRPSATTATGNAIRERLLSLSSACRHHVVANPTSPASTTSSSLKGVRQDLQVTRRRQGREHQPPAWNMAGKPVQLPSSDPGLHPSRQGLDHLRSHQAPGSSTRLGHPHSGVDQLPTAACSVTALPSVRRYAGCQGRLPGLVYGYIYIYTRSQRPLTLYQRRRCPRGSRRTSATPSTATRGRLRTWEGRIPNSTSSSILSAKRDVASQGFPRV
jgi:hypothetical protein